MAAINRAVCFVFRQEPDLPVAAGETLHCGLVLQQRHHDLAVLSGFLLVDHYQITGENACVQHGLAPNTQGEKLPVPTLGVEGDIIVNALLRQDGCTGGHIAQYRYPAGSIGCLLHRRDLLRDGGGIRPLHQGQGPALAPVLAQVAQLLQMLNMKMHGGGGLQPHGLADFPDGGRIALVADKGRDIVVDSLLHGGQFLHTIPSCLISSGPKKPFWPAV